MINKYRQITIKIIKLDWLISYKNKEYSKNGLLLYKNHIKSNFNLK